MPDRLHPVSASQLTPRQITPIERETGVPYLDWNGKSMDIVVRVLAAGNGLAYDDLADIPMDQLSGMVDFPDAEPAEPGEVGEEDDADPSVPVASLASRRRRAGR